MNIRLGEKIRNLRKQNNLSQDVLAQFLGVSFQAVSKWENGTTMPDVSMIPAIASFFNVSTDELFDFNRAEQEKKIQQLCWDAAQYRFSDPKRSEDMLRDALKQYPGNDVILNNLLYTMRSPERNDEVVTLCKSILEVTRDDEVKYDVLRILAETYADMDMPVLAKQTLELVPELYFSKLELLANLLRGEEAMDAAYKHACVCRDGLLDMLSRLSQLHRIQGNTEKSAEFANLTRIVFRFFEKRTDYLGYNQEQESIWLDETIWPRLEA